MSQHPDHAGSGALEPPTGRAGAQGRPPADAPGVWVRTEAECAAMAGHLAGASIMALDSESDGLHRFPEKVCLVQAAHPDGTVYLVDPLAFSALAPLGALCADPRMIKVLHGAAFDVAALKRDFGFAFRGVFDTMLAAQLLGLPDLGLNGLLARELGVCPAPSRQKDDWSRRPLSPSQEAYAAGDVRHLIALREALVAQLRAKGRESWLEEECREQEAAPALARSADPESYLRLKGARALDRRGLAVLRELHGAREAWAHEFGRPPFRLVGNETLLAAARARPDSLEALRAIPGCTARVVGRLGERLLAAVCRGMACSDGALPVHPRRERPYVAPAIRRRIDALTAWRAAAAGRWGLDPGVLLPRRLLERAAAIESPSLEALAEIDGMKRWRVAALGPELLAVLADCAAEGGNDAGRSR